MSRETRIRGIRLGGLGGVDVFLDRSWFVITALVVVIYGPVLWRLHPQVGWLNLLLALAFAVGLAGCVLVHELAHALVGRRLGWPVDRIVLTLMGGHTSFGAVRATAWSSALVSLVGPLANLAVAGIGTAALQVAPEQGNGPGWALVELLVLANWVLGFFNLLPGLPLDGGRVVESVVWKITGSESRGTMVAAWCGRGLAVLVVLWVLWQGSWRSLPTLLVAVMVAVFIYQGASQALHQVQVLARVRPLTASAVQRPAVEFSPGTSLALVDASVLATTSHEYRGWTPDVVARDPRSGRVGVLNPRAAAQVDQGHRQSVAVSDVMDWHPANAVTAEGVQGHELLRQLEVNGFPWLLVVDTAGHVTGVVHHGDIARHALRE